MNLSPAPGDRTPLWVVIIVVITALPVVALPILIGRVQQSDVSDTVRLLLWGYPFYVLVGGWLACISYKTRQYMTWILVLLMALTHAAMWLLASPEPFNTLS